MDVLEGEKPREKNSLLKILLKDVSAFGTGICLGVICLVLIFFTLNYFNIISLSALLPNGFGWLSHQNNSTYKTNEPDITPRITNNSQEQQKNRTSLSYVKFSYEDKKAKLILERYIRDNIRENFLPAKIDVQQHLTSSGKLEGTDYEFGSNWQFKNIVFNAVLHYVRLTNDLRDTEFFINPTIPTTLSINAVNTAILINTYLKNIPESVDFDCGEYKQTIAYCEHFETKDRGKSGVGVVNIKDESVKNTVFIFSCFVPKNDSYYNKRTSCLMFREKDQTGL